MLHDKNLIFMALTVGIKARMANDSSYQKTMRSAPSFCMVAFEVRPKGFIAL
jgi:hypothetical protein